MDTNSDTNSRILLCTVGLPRAGKSTYVQKLNLPVVNPDGVRLALTGRRWYSPIEHEIWATAITMIRSLFLGGHNIVVLDSTNFRRRYRDTFIPSYDCMWKRRFVVFDTPVNVCKERAEKTYPELCEVIDRFVENWEPIEREEGQIIETINYIP